MLSQPQRADAGSLMTLLTKMAQHPVFEAFVDFAVCANVLALGLAVDLEAQMPTLFTILRHVFCVFYLLEYLVRLFFGNAIQDIQHLIRGVKGKDASRVLAHAQIIWDAAVISLLIVDLWFLDQVLGVWWFPLLRLHRASHALLVANQFPQLVDLWLVVVGLARAVPALLWLSILLLTVVFTCGSVVMGLMRLNTGEVSGLDIDEYFGSMAATCFTLFQVATLDDWASQVVRPLLEQRPAAAVFLVIFVVTTAYGLLSIAIGVLVWSTVELARTHHDHGSHSTNIKDQEIVEQISEYFRAILVVSERQKLDMKEVKDAMSVPVIRDGLKNLNLPLTDAAELFDHIDKAGTGELSVDEFEDGLLKLREPTSRFDMACLTAQIGSSVAITTRLDKRSEALLETMHALSASLVDAFAELGDTAYSEEQVEVAPEVGLRRSRAIRPGPPPKVQRYTG